MSGKNQVPITLNWQSTNPATGFLPLNANTANGGSTPSKVPAGTMAATDTIYSQIMDVSRFDNIGLELVWSGTPTGAFQIMASVSGQNFTPLTFCSDFATDQPIGASGSLLVNLNNYPFRYFMVQYTNVSGAGSLTGSAQMKDLN